MRALNVDGNRLAIHVQNVDAVNTHAVTHGNDGRIAFRAGETIEERNSLFRLAEFPDGAKFCAKLAGGGEFVRLFLHRGQDYDKVRSHSYNLSDPGEREPDRVSQRSPGFLFQLPQNFSRRAKP